MEKLFLNYKLSLLAKEKGFNELCLAYWELNQHSNPKEGVSWEKLSMWANYSILEEFEDYRLILTDNEWSYKTMIKAPLYQQIIDWFREKHGIHIRVDFGSFGSGKTPTEIEFGYYYADVWYYYSNPRRIKVNWEGDETQFRGAMPIKNLTWYQVADMAIEEAFKLINI